MHSDSVSIELYCNDICIGAARMLWNIKKTKYDYEGEIGRIRLDSQHVKELFNRAYIMAISQHRPFHIIVTEDNKHTVLENVWFEFILYSYTTDKFIIINQARIVVESIF